MTDYLRLRPKPDFFNLRLRLRPPNFITENFHLSQRFRFNGFFPLIEHKSFGIAFILIEKSIYNRYSKSLLFAKGKLAAANK